MCNWVKTFYTDQISCILRNDPIISGIKFNDSEYLANQYADDTSLTLEDDPVSLERCLQIFDKFGDCAGLRANLNKTQLFGLVLGMVVASNTYLIVTYFGITPENLKSWVLNSTSVAQIRFLQFPYKIKKS